MQPDYKAQAHPADMPVGIVLIVLNALGVCAGVALLAGGGLLGAIGGAASMRGNTQVPGGALAIGGGVMMVIGVVLMILYAISIYGAIGVMQSRKQGFLIVLVLGAIALLANLAQMASNHSGIFGVGLGILAPLYAYLRLSGNLPPKVEY